MDTRIAPGGVRLDVVATDTASRVTPASGVPFQDILAGGAGALLRGAQAAVSALPGAPIVAAAIRPGGGSVSPAVSAAAISPGIGSAGMATPAGGMSGLLPTVPGVSTPAVSGTAESPAASASGANEQGSIENALAQSQQFNLYYLQLQEQLSAENRAYSAMSNVLKARHDTIKNAIGNIR